MRVDPATLKSVRTWHSVNRTDFENEIQPLGQPALLKDLVGDWPVISEAKQSTVAWRHYLSQLATDELTESFHGNPAMGGFFTFTDDLQRFNFDRRKQTVSDLLRMIADPDREPASRYCYGGAINVPKYLPGLADGHQNPLLGDDVEQLMSVWLGTETRIPAHWDLPQNLACVAVGRRRFTLFPIDQVGNLYIGPLDITIAGQPSSLVDPYAPDLERFPCFPEALQQALVAELEPGDALYIPSLWLHHVESLDCPGMLVNYWWREPATTHQFTPLHSLFHAILSIKNLPANERQAWHALFEHYIFRPNSTNPANHLPSGKQGVLGKLDAQQEQNLRKFLASRLLG